MEGKETWREGGGGGRERKREREREGGRERERERDRQTDRQTDRDRESRLRKQATTTVEHLLTQASRATQGRQETETISR